MTVAVQKPRRRSMDVGVTHQDMAPGSSDEIRTFRATSYIVCCQGSQQYKRFLRKETLVELLAQVREGEPFSFKSGMTTSKNLDESMYRLAVNWMRAHGLCVKNGLQVTIPSVEKVRRAYNQQLQEEASL